MRYVSMRELVIWAALAVAEVCGSERPAKGPVSI